MALLSVETIVRDGLEQTKNAADVGGDEFLNTGNEIVHIVNGDGSPMTVTIETPVVVDGLAVAERTVAIGANEERFIGPFPASTYNDANSKVQLTYSSITSLTIAVLLVGA